MSKQIGGFSILRNRYLSRLRTRSQLLDYVGPAHRNWEILREIFTDGDESLVKLLQKSKSQLCQDLFVLSQTAHKQGGYFVEFGAADGLKLSNTHLLESERGWTGILAEPAKCWHESLIRNRSCSIDTNCVWLRTGEQLSFVEAEYAEISTIEQFSQSDRHAKARLGGKEYVVDTISLEDLLRKHSAPKHVDYLSIDTEGSEYDILAAHDFEQFSFGIITVEHNGTSMRGKIRELLLRNGYVPWHPELTKWDDWYIRAP